MIKRKVDLPKYIANILNIFIQKIGKLRFNMYWILMSTIILSTTTLGKSKFEFNNILITRNKNSAIHHIDNKLYICKFL